MFRTWFGSGATDIVKIGFENMKDVVASRDTIIINTLATGEQDCLIQGTLSANDEERIINAYLEKGAASTKKVVVYGKHSCDISAHEKCVQLKSLGFCDIYLYAGGLFEWLLLQDIYGEKEFPTTSKVLDILKYRPPKIVV